jgi:choline-sulfatase
MWYKMSFFEGSARVPMLFYSPERFQSGRIKAPVSLVDLLPTLVEIGNDGQAVDFVDRLDGNSLLSMIASRKSADAAPVAGEMLGEGVIAPMFMVRHGRYKYIYSRPDPEQLYDLEVDPNELNNLVGQDACKELHQSFYNEMLGRWNPDKIKQDILESQRRRRFLDRALRRGQFKPWDFQPVRDASQQYMRNHLDLNILEKSSRYPSPDVPPPDGPGG